MNMPRIWSSEIDEAEPYSLDMRHPDRVEGVIVWALDLDQAIRRLEADDPRAARVVELHYFAGIPLEGIADLLEVSARTVHRDWQYARAFLGTQLEG